jgi:hypothetical protein
MGKFIKLFKILKLPISIATSIAIFYFILNDLLKYNFVANSYIKSQIPNDFSFEGKICFLTK